MKLTVGVTLVAMFLIACVARVAAPDSPRLDPAAVAPGAAARAAATSR